jgi:hypothetical protein
MVCFTMKLKFLIKEATIMLLLDDHVVHDHT